MQRPNILIFMTDHQRADMAPPFGRAKTPNLDALCARATAFTNAYCPSPHCCPSRATFFSGQFPSRHGVWNNVDTGNALSRGLAAGVRLWSEDLREGGYELFYAGKWHVSAEEGPAGRGFSLVHHRAKYTGIPRADEMRRPLLRDWLPYARGPLCCAGDAREPGEILRPGYPRYRLYGVDEHPFGDEETVEASARFVRGELAGRRAPWCFYVGVTGPHDPYCVPQKYLDWYGDERVELPASFHDRMQDKPALYRRTQSYFSQLTEAEHVEALRHYLAFCSYEDALFGRLLDALREAGQYEDTVIVYTSDHGDYAGAHGLWAKGLPCFSEAYHVPLIVKLPGQAAQRTVDARASHADFAPTILDLAGIPAREAYAGISLKPYLLGESLPARPYTFTQSNGNELYGIQRSIASDRWKYVYNGFDEDELYDLKGDPGEMCNLIGDARYEPVVRELCAALWEFSLENDDASVNPYIMTGQRPYGPEGLAERVRARFLEGNG